MSRWFEYYALLIGRILVGGFFLWNGILYAINLEQTTKAFATYTPHGVDPIWFALVLIALYVAGGISIVVDWKLRYFSLALAIYFVAATLLFHSALQDASATNYFLKNMALIGALLYISATSN